MKIKFQPGDKVLVRHNRKATVWAVEDDDCITVKFFKTNTTAAFSPDSLKLVRRGRRKPVMAGEFL